jgi:hypothetical protein
MQDAVQSILPNTHQHQGMSRRDGMTTSVGHGNRSALAIRQLFTIHDQVLKWVDVYKYLGHLLSQDDDDVQAVRAQICKACTTWACVGNMLQAHNAALTISALFYKVVVQSVLLNGSETWVLTKMVLARLEGFHIRAAYKMAKRHIP